ncbi:uncharacterized protein RHOBADRAFT_47304 [Rhodotorula graminis WP1]|uniref:MICOS complex subunit n=1 Tax=Rhodotorula graminis (strain WP1) TaxID=578459 RepID=A0A0P9GWQ0_RHOGW|nr:uncharacterized protein RHOBADRAFT_47304 [Rhodotorula graminis WP1]KPV71852.1 hypothetical protein RHOBADRAFT_47304 [Rhodotorula graminis WP1]
MGILFKLVASSAAVAGAGLYLAPDLAHQQLAHATGRTAPAPSSSSTSSPRPADPETLSLYDSPPQPALLVPVKSPLQDEVALARSHAQMALDRAAHATHDLRETLVGYERHAEVALKSVISDKDQLNPNAFYVAVATLAGSIVGRNRILLRLSLPPLFLLGSTAYFLPNSWDKIVPRLGLSDDWKYANARAKVRDAKHKVEDKVKA